MDAHIDEEPGEYEVSASVVWRTRIQQDDDAEVAAELDVGLRTLQRRRQRAERQLAKAG